MAMNVLRDNRTYQYYSLSVSTNRPGRNEFQIWQEE